MVLVEPAAAVTDTPEDAGSATAQAPSPAQEASPSTADVTSASFDDAADLFNEQASNPSTELPDLTETVEDISVQGRANSPAEADSSETGDVGSWQEDPDTSHDLDDVALAEQSPPPRPAADEVLLPDAEWTSASTVQWRNRILTGIAAVVGVVLALMLFIVFGGSDEQSTTALGPGTAEIQPSSDAVSDDSIVADSPPPDAPTGVDVESSDQNAIESDSSAVVPHHVGPEDSSSPPIAGVVEPLAPETTGAEPLPDPIEAAPGPPTTDEPPGLTPKEPTKDAPATGGEPSPLSETLRDFGALLEEPAPPAIPMPAVDAELPSALDADETDEEPVVRRPGPRVVELDDRLNDPVAQIEFKGVPLANFLRFASDYSTIPITLDADILRWAHVSPSTLVKLNATDTTIAEMLTQGLAPLGFEYRTEADQLFVTRRSRDESGVRTVTFKVEDLVGDGAEALQQFAAQIMNFVEPETWSGRGGIGTITLRERELVIEQHETVQFEILGFCETLRVARGLKTRSPYDASMFRLATRNDRTRDKLAKSVTLTYIRPAPLDRIVDRLAKSSELQILIDWRALADVGWSPDAELRFSVADLPITKALTMLLDPMELTYRVVDESTLQITTPAVLESRLEVEFYHIAKLEGDGSMLVDSAREALGIAIFQDSGESGRLAFDAQSSCLLARLNQGQQVELQAWLAAPPEALTTSTTVGTTIPTSTVESRIVPASGRASND